MPKNKRRNRTKRKWSKIKIREVEEYLTSKVEKELLGDPSKRKDSELFFVDKSKRVLTPQQRKEEARSKKHLITTRLDRYPHLNPTSPIQKKKKTPGYIPPAKKKLILKKIKQKRAAAATPANQHQKHQSPSSTSKLQQKNKHVFDVWAPEEDPRDKFLEKFPEVEKEYLEVKRVKVHKKIEPSLLPAVAVPAEGASYNPDDNQYNLLLKEAVNEQIKHRTELNKLKKQLKAEPYRRSTLPEVDFLPGEHLNYNPQEEPEPSTTASTTTTAEESDTNPPKIFLPHVPMKTRADRNREARRKAAEVYLKKKLLLKEKKKRLQFIEAYKKEIEKHEMELQQKSEQRTLKKEEEPYKTKKLGAERFEEEDIQVLLPEQLPKKISHVKTHFDPVKDRFKHFQRRNIIEPRSNKKRSRRYPMKYVEKYSFRAYREQQEKQYENA